MATIKHIAGVVASAIVAAGAVSLGSAPVGQDVVRTVNNTQAVQQQQQRKQARANQQKAQQPQQRIVNNNQSNYLPSDPRVRATGKLIMDPRQYGEWLMITGKNKYNNRRRKQYAKALS